MSQPVCSATQTMNPSGTSASTDTTNAIAESQEKSHLAVRLGLPRSVPRPLGGEAASTTFSEVGAAVISAVATSGTALTITVPRKVQPCCQRGMPLKDRALELGSQPARYGLKQARLNHQISDLLAVKPGGLDLGSV